MDQAREAAQAVTEFFQGNPFGTPIGRMIEQATESSLPSENWALNMEICDAVNTLADGPRDAVRAIRKRLQTNVGKNNTTVLYTLTVLETLVKNCDIRLLHLIAQKEFCQDLIKLISSKYDPPQVVQEKVLTLIQSWADAFRGKPDLRGVCEIYDELKAKGVDFPATDIDSMAPILTPRRSLPDSKVYAQPAAAASPAGTPRQQSQQQKHERKPPNDAAPIAAGPLINLSAEQLGKLRSELDIVNGNIKVLREMLAELHPGKEDADDYKLLQDLHSTCKAMQIRIMELLERVSNEEVTSELLMINDEMNNVFAKYDRYTHHRSHPAAEGHQQGQGQPQNFKGQAPKQASATKPDESSSLIDFGGNDQSAAAAAARPATSTYADNINLDQLNVGLGTAAQQRGSGGISAIKDKAQDIADMEAWLKANPGARQETSEEFDKFLSQRAANGDRPSDSASTTISTNQQQAASGERRVKTKEETEERMFAL